MLYPLGMAFCFLWSIEIRIRMGEKVMRILILDDSSFMRMMLRKMLERGDHEIVGEAENGKEAIWRYMVLTPDLVVMDITMPILSGIEAVKEICSHDPNAKVLMCSAMGQHSIIRECIEYGAKGFITKPFQAECILEEIERIS